MAVIETRYNATTLQIDRLGFSAGELHDLEIASDRADKAVLDRDSLRFGRRRSERRDAAIEKDEVWALVHGLAPSFTGVECSSGGCG